MPPGKYFLWSLEDFQKHYKENYSGKNRTEVSKLDYDFYQRLYHKGWLDKVFPKKDGKFTKEYLEELKRNTKTKNNL